MTKRAQQALPFKVQVKPDMIEAIEVTAANLDAVVEWLGYDLGNCMVAERDDYITTHMYSGEACGQINRGDRLVRIGRRGNCDVLQFSQARFSQMFDTLQSRQITQQPATDPGVDVLDASQPTMTVNHDGAREWRVDGKRHRTDGPAIESADGSKQWWVNGKRHRTGGPAVEWADGTKSWWVDGKRHRIDGPAIDWPDGSKAWLLDGKRHRTNGPAVEWAGGTQEWWLNGQRFVDQKAWEAAGGHMATDPGGDVASLPNTAVVSEGPATATRAEAAIAPSRPAEIIGAELDRLIAEHTQEGAGATDTHWRGPDYVDGRDAGIEFAVEQIRGILGRVFPGQPVSTAPGDCATCGYQPNLKVYADGSPAECSQCGAQQGIRVFG